MEFVPVTQSCRSIMMINTSKTCHWHREKKYFNKTVTVNMVCCEKPWTVAWADGGFLKLSSQWRVSAGIFGVLTWWMDSWIKMRWLSGNKSVITVIHSQSVTSTYCSLLSLFKAWLQWHFCDTSFQAIKLNTSALTPNLNTLKAGWN